MGNLKKKIKKIVSKTGRKIPFRTMMREPVARRILEDWSPCPNGSCITKNEIDLQYDLQIVIPAYNVQDFIKECLDSVITQITKYRYLVTVVNDGSQDKTTEILSQYDKQKVEFLTGGGYTLEVITQENCGFSGARNRAIETIKGTYILFLDSDDVLPPDTIESMINVAKCKEIDLLQGAWYDFDMAPDHHIMDHHMLAKDIISDGTQISGFPWGKLYRWNVLQHFKFPEGFWFEDTPVSFMLAFMPYHFGMIDKFVYAYRQNPKGITAISAKRKKSIDTFWITEKCLQEFSAFSLDYNQEAYEYLLKQSIMNWGRTRMQPRKIRKAIFVLTSNLVDIYFRNMKTSNAEMKDLEESLKKRKFIKYEAFMLK